MTVKGTCGFAEIIGLGAMLNRIWLDIDDAGLSINFMLPSGSTTLTGCSGRMATSCLDTTFFLVSVRPRRLQKRGRSKLSCFLNACDCIVDVDCCPG
jgi:hypothetical protein